MVILEPQAYIRRRPDELQHCNSLIWVSKAEDLAVIVIDPPSG